MSVGWVVISHLVFDLLALNCYCCCCLAILFSVSSISLLHLIGVHLIFVRSVLLFFFSSPHVFCFSLWVCTLFFFFLFVVFPSAFFPNCMACLSFCYAHYKLFAIFGNCLQLVKFEKWNKQRENSMKHTANNMLFHCNSENCNAKVFLYFDKKEWKKKKKLLRRRRWQRWEMEKRKRNESTRNLRKKGRSKNMKHTSQNIKRYWELLPFGRSGYAWDRDRNDKAQRKQNERTMNEWHIDTHTHIRKHWEWEFPVRKGRTNNNNNSSSSIAHTSTPNTARKKTKLNKLSRFPSWLE